MVLPSVYSLALPLRRSRSLLLLVASLCTTVVRGGHHWAAVDRLVVDRGSDEDRFGVAVKTVGDMLVIGADGDDDRGDGAGAAYVYKLNGRRYSLVQKLTALNGRDNDGFGLAVDAGPDVIAVAAPKHIQDPGAKQQAGAVYIFRYNSTTNKWDQDQELKSDAPDQVELFGTSIAFINDYSLLLVGAPGSTDTPGTFYVFKLNTGNNKYEFLSKRQADPPRNNNAAFGKSIGGDGEYVVVGAYQDINPNSTKDTGSVFIFRTLNNGTSFTQEANLFVQNGQNKDQFGFAVAIAGTTIAAGAPRWDDNHIGGDCGAVYIYTLDTASSVWLLKQKVDRTTLYNRITQNSAEGLFGLALSMTPQKLAIGSNMNTRVGGVNSGAVYLMTFKKGKWKKEDSVIACEQAERDNFGSAISLDMKTQKLAVGSVNGGSKNAAFSDPGAAYVFKRFTLGFKILRYAKCRILYN